MKLSISWIFDHIDGKWEKQDIDYLIKKFNLTSAEIEDFYKVEFDLDKKIVYSSGFGFKSKRTQRIIDTVRAVGGDIYLSGSGGRNYLDTSLFKDIKLEFQDFKHPVYRQCYQGFVPNMSAIDALFNVGEMPQSLEDD